MAPNVPDTASNVRADAPPRAASRRVDSKTLLGTNNELLILHNGREYRLRLTQNDKLILTA